MGKRSNFDRIPRDFYPTPIEAVRPLVPHLPKQFSYWEPCAGDGALVCALQQTAPGGILTSAHDIEPRVPWVERADCLEIEPAQRPDLIITNPPWERAKLHAMIEYFTALAPTWLLFDADWKHTKQAAPYLKNLAKIVSVGRVKWIPDSKHTGKDNCCWYLFDQNSNAAAEFIGRAA